MGYVSPVLTKSGFLVFLLAFAPPTSSETSEDASSRVFDRPPHLPPSDRFGSPQEACDVLVSELGKDFSQIERSAVYAWCGHRTMYSTRGKGAKSRVDGSQIHDRDRHAGWKIWRWGVSKGLINPGTCEAHRIDYEADHPEGCLKLMRKWPFKVPELTEKRLKGWKRHPHAMESVSTRGPHDNNYVMAQVYMPGCWAIEAMDRNDVSVSVTVKRAFAICEKHGCRSKKDIKEHW